MMALPQIAPPPRAFYAGDPLVVAPRLLGCVLAHRHPQRGLLLGRIVETEAYRGEEDLACHAAAGRTARTAIMYGPPGFAYIYLIYGMHHMLNVVTGAEDDPSAVLIRAIEPVSGIQRSTNGPGKLALALDLDRELNGADLCGDRLFISLGPPVAPDHIRQSPRINVDYAGEWAARPWRYFLAGNPHVSKAPSRPRPGPNAIAATLDHE